MATVKKKHKQCINDNLIGLSGLQKRIEKSKSWVYKQIELGLFPRPYKVGRSSLWSENEVSDYIEKVKSRGV